LETKKGCKEGCDEKMKKNAIIIIAIILVLILAFVAIGMGVFTDDKWTSETQFGKWGRELILVYEDGTTQSLKTVRESMILSVIYNGQKLAGLYDTVSAQATGTGYSTATISLSSFTDTYTTKQSSTVKNTKTVSGIPSSVNIAVDGQWYQLFKIYTPIEAIVPSSLAVGTYTITLAGSGSIAAEGTSVSLPPSVSITVEVRQDKSITIQLKRG